MNVMCYFPFALKDITDMCTCHGRIVLMSKKRFICFGVGTIQSALFDGNSKAALSTFQKYNANTSNALTQNDKKAAATAPPKEASHFHRNLILSYSCVLPPKSIYS